MKIIGLVLLTGFVLAVAFGIFIALAVSYAQRAIDEELPEQHRSTKAPRLPRG